MPVVLWQLALASAITAGAASLQGTIGFGFALICVPLLSLIDPALAPVPQLLLILPLSITVAWRERHDADLRAVPWVTLGRLPGAAIGVMLLAAFDERALGITIALMVLAAVGLVSTGITLPRNPVASLTAGMVSGTASLVAAIGGPPLALLYRSAKGATVRASLGMVFAIGVTISLTARWIASEISGDDLLVAALLLPSMAFGLWAGRSWARHIDGPHLRTAILVVSATSAAVLLIQSLV
jgi:uncharacterized membrane protein YfcA